MLTDERNIALVEQLVSLDAEKPDVEFKVNNFDPDRIATLISAISNSARLNDKQCGYVVWGVQDETHEIVGTDFRPSKEKSNGQPLELWLSNSISPSLHFTFREVPHPKGRIVLLEVPAASQIPTKYKNISYIRLGSATPKLADHPAVEASLLSKLRPFVWEQGIARSFVSTEEVLSLLDFPEFFRLTRNGLPSSDEQIAMVLANDRLISRDVGGRWNIHNLGAILFANDVSKFEGIHRKVVRVIKYQGLSRSDSANETMGNKGYAVGFDPLVDFINKRLPTQEVIRRALRAQRPLYPEIAIRELVANALLHQDMTIPGTGPVIEIFSDRVEITNPGKPLLETDRFIDLSPRSRNESLAWLMRKIGVCEERGSGIDKVIESVEESKLPPPEFRADGDSTKAIIFGPKSFGELTPEERVRGCYQHAVLRFVNTHAGMTNGSLRERFGVAERNASQISRVIKQAIEIGAIKPSDNWTARAGHYLPFWA